MRNFDIVWQGADSPGDDAQCRTAAIHLAADSDEYFVLEISRPMGAEGTRVVTVTYHEHINSMPATIRELPFITGTMYHLQAAAIVMLYQVLDDDGWFNDDFWFDDDDQAVISASLTRKLYVGERM